MTSQQPPMPPQPPAAPKKRRSRKWWWVGGVVVVIIIIVAATSGGGKKKPTASDETSIAPVTAAAVAVTPSNTPPTVASSKPAPPPKTTVTLLAMKGNGIKNTKNFTARTNQWTIHYAYNCANFGSSGNFAITVNDRNGQPVDISANELGHKGKSSTVEHTPGTYSLGINSECNWTVRITERR